MEYYDKMANGYEALYRDEQLRKLAIIQKEINPTSLLDIGCGSGISLEPWKCRKIGVDSSFELLKIAKTKGLLVVQAKAEYLPFKKQCFETILAVSAVHHFKDKAFDEIERIKKGKVIVSLPKKSKKIEEIKKKFRKSIEEEKDLILFS